MDKTTQILEDTHTRLSNINSWCPDGAGSGEQLCLFATMGTIAYKHDSGFLIPCAGKFLDEAFERVMGKPPVIDDANDTILDLNDGSGAYQALSKEERWQLILKIVTKAIELSKESEF